MSTDLHLLESALGHTFRDQALLRLALTHPSAAHDPSKSLAHNQRLEFLGDAVLQLILTHELYERFPEVGEGPLTKARARLVNRRILAELAGRVDLGVHLRLGRGEESHGGRERPSALADAFEAVLGALFLDGGLEIVRRFILRLMHEEIGQLAEPMALDNPKGELQELLQSGSVEPPQYTVENATGPDHDREFECSVAHLGVVLGRGRGKSKKDAESQAALAALRKLSNLDPQP